MNYLKSEAKRIITDLGYDYNYFDIDYLANEFDKRYSDDFEEYYIWLVVIEDYINSDKCHIDK